MNEAQLRETADTLELAREQLRSMAAEIAHLRRELDHSNRSRRTMQSNIDSLQQQVVEQDTEIGALRSVAYDLFGVVKPDDMRVA